MPLKSEDGQIQILNIILKKTMCEKPRNQYPAYAANNSDDGQKKQKGFQTTQ